MKPVLTLGTARSDAAMSPQDAIRAWNISDARAKALKERARDMRRNPTDAQAKLWERLKDSKLGSFNFRPQVVMGSAIVDFACRPRWLVVEITSSDEAHAAIEALSDRKLTAVGVRVMRFAEQRVMEEIDAVCDEILAELRAPFERPQIAGPASGGERSQKAPRRDFNRQGSIR